MPVTALALLERGLSEPVLYGTAGATLEIIKISDDGADLPRSLEMPGEVRELAWNEAATLVHVLGEAPAGGPTVYVVEPNGNTVFIDVPLPRRGHGSCWPTPNPSDQMTIAPSCWRSRPTVT